MSLIQGVVVRGPKVASRLGVPADSAQFAESPFLIRVAGLSIESLRPFASNLVRDHLLAIYACRDEIRDLRSELVDLLYKAVKGAEPIQRRLLLSIKRDCHNGRSLFGRSKPNGWKLLNLGAETTTKLERLIELEQSLARRSSHFEAAYRQQVEVEREALLVALGDRSFARGLALGSTVTLASARKLQKAHRWPPSRRIRRLEMTLGRYISRAAAKLSPFSTLTQVGLGRISDLPAGPLLPMDLEATTAWRQLSSVRLRRHVVNQCCDLLLEHRPFLHTLPLELNPTLHRGADGVVTIVSPAKWRYDEPSSTFVHTQPTSTSLELGGKLFDWLLATLAGRALDRQRLLERMCQDFAAAELTRKAASRYLDRVVELGVLRHLPPWREDDPWLEKTLVESLQALAKPEPQVVSITRKLLRLLRLADSYQETRSPLKDIVEAERLVEEALNEAASLVGLDPQTPSEPVTTRYLTEDVFLATTKGREQPEIARLSAASANHIVDRLGPVAQLAGLMQRRHDILATFAGLWQQHWAETERVSFWDFFGKAKSTFLDYVKFRGALRGTRDFDSRTFDPLRLDRLAQLAQSREEIARGLPELLDGRGDEIVLDSAGLAERLDRLPGEFARGVPFSVMLQPLTHDGRARWVLNCFAEGIGHHSSRFSTIMDSEARRVWQRAYLDRAVREERNGEVIELIDVACVADNNVNIHAAHTPRVLALSRSATLRPASDCLTLGEVVVELDPICRLPRLLDPSTGHYLQPVHLGGLVFRFLPTMFKFLTLFGPEELHCKVPHLSFRRDGELPIRPRHRVDDIVLLRKAWLLDRQELLAQIVSCDSSEAFARINQWRSKTDMPDCIFVREPLAGGVENPDIKPQLIDFRSPLFVDIFRQILEIDMPRIAVEEALPNPDSGHIASWECGEQRAFEIHLDSFTVRSPDLHCGVQDIRSPELHCGAQEMTTGALAPTLGG